MGHFFTAVKVDQPGFVGSINQNIIGVQVDMI